MKLAPLCSIVLVADWNCRCRSEDNVSIGKWRLAEPPVMRAFPSCASQRMNTCKRTCPGHARRLPPKGAHATARPKRAGKAAGDKWRLRCDDRASSRSARRKPLVGLAQEIVDLAFGHHAHVFPFLEGAIPVRSESQAFL